MIKLLKKTDAVVSERGEFDNRMKWKWMAIFTMFGLPGFQCNENKSVFVVICSFHLRKFNWDGAGWKSASSFEEKRFWPSKRLWNKENIGKFCFFKLWCIKRSATLEGWKPFYKPKILDWKSYGRNSAKSVAGKWVSSKKQLNFFFSYPLEQISDPVGGTFVFLRHEKHQKMFVRSSNFFPNSKLGSILFPRAFNWSTLMKDFIDIARKWKTITFYKTVLKLLSLKSDYSMWPESLKNEQLFNEINKKFLK